jgi:UDP-N-acetylglucosamine 2-epimerase (non-hydrolysing)/GDP/UDP-N,N'-diacetylbacillosamine 2-epimerase (hydrolysing)
LRRSIAVVTVARSDYGIYRPVLRAIALDPHLELRIIASGMHLSPEFGYTARAIEEDGFTISDRVEMLLSGDSPESVAKSVGLGVIGFSQVFGRSRPDILVVLGDRFEMYAAALAALPFKIPVAHLHGGELTSGAIDDALRHSMTKLSHLHFVSTEDYRRRVIQLGEDPDRIVVSGAPSLDQIETEPRLTASELEKRFGVKLSPAPLLVTFHPVTLEYENTESQIGELLAALDQLQLPVVFTAPNADTSGRIVRQAIEHFVKTHDRAWLVENFEQQGYFTFLDMALAMVGNSSSGIIEAASFGLPVVNIGSRQCGRVRGANVIDTGYGRDEVRKAIQRAIAPEFRQAISSRANPYRGAGPAAAAIVQRLKSQVLGDRLLQKTFRDFDVCSKGSSKGL